MAHISKGDWWGGSCTDTPGSFCVGMMGVFMQITQSDIKVVFTHCFERILTYHCLEDICCPKFRGRLFYGCAKSVWYGSPSHYSVFLIQRQMCILSYPWNRHNCGVGPLQEAQHMAVLCCKLNALIVTRRSCGRKVTLYSMARHILCLLNTAVVFHCSGNTDNRSCLALMCRILKNQYNSNNKGLLPSRLLFPGHTEQQWLCH